MASVLDILNVVLGIVSVSELFKLAWRFFAGRLPSGRRRKVQNALDRRKVQLHRLERGGFLSEQGPERQEIDEQVSSPTHQVWRRSDDCIIGRLIKRLDDLSQGVEDWEARGITRYFDYPAAVKLLRRCSELEKDAAQLRARLRRQVPKLDIDAPVPLARIQTLGDGLRYRATAPTQRQQTSPSPSLDNVDLARDFGASSSVHQWPHVQPSEWVRVPNFTYRSISRPSTRRHQVYDGPHVASGVDVEPLHGAGPVSPTQSWVSQSHSASPPSAPSSKPRGLSYRPAAAVWHRMSSSNPHQASYDLPWSVSPSDHTRRSRLELQGGPGNHPSRWAPPTNEEYYVQPPPHWQDSPNEDISEVPDDFEPLEL